MNSIIYTIILFFNHVINEVSYQGQVQRNIYYKLYLIFFIAEIPLWNAIQNPRRDRKFGSRQCWEEKLSWDKNKQEVEQRSCIFT